MTKRILAAATIAAGVAILTGSLVYWRAQRVLADPAAVWLPESLASAPLTRSIYGKQAVTEIGRMHRQDFPLSSGAVGMYGASGQAMLWVSGAPIAPLAARMVAEMDSAIADGDSPFTSVGVRAVDRRDVYELVGMGQRHFYFQSGALVVWLAADAQVAEAALAQTLDYYP